MAAVMAATGRAIELDSSRPPPRAMAPLIIMPISSTALDRVWARCWATASVSICFWAEAWMASRASSTGTTALSATPSLRTSSTAWGRVAGSAPSDNAGSMASLR
jgi:hypothetical protein